MMRNRDCGTFPGENFREAAAERGLYVATRADLKELVRASIDGYGDDYPLLNWFDQGGDGTRLEHVALHPKGWKATWKANLSDVFEQSIVVADSPSIRAFAMWLPPHYKPASNMRWLLCGGLGAFFHLGVAELSRFDRYEQFCNAQHFRFAPDAFYIYNLVTRRKFQGQGLGSNLVRTSLEIIDMMGTSAYLETHKEKNVGFYEKFGFEVVCDEVIPGTRLPHYAMRRRGLVRGI